MRVWQGESFFFARAIYYLWGGTKVFSPVLLFKDKGTKAFVIMKIGSNWFPGPGG